MSAVIDGALRLWGLPGADVRLIATRENQVFRVDQGDRSLALRLHRPGYRTDHELLCEIQWMAALADGGLNVPAPVAAQDGSMLQTVDGVQISMLGWLDAQPMGKIGTPLVLPDRAGLFFSLGAEMARLHAISDRWTPPVNFQRWAWNREGLLGEAPLWDRFWDNPTLNQQDRSMLERFRKDAQGQLRDEETAQDYGLIHADLVPENVMRGADGSLYLIDFDDGGFGFRLFDVATALIKNRDEPDYVDLRAALIAGYHSQRPLDMGALDLFMALRAVTYVGWLISRRGEAGADVRNERYLKQARSLISAL